MRKFAAAFVAVVAIAGLASAQCRTTSYAQNQFHAVHAPHVANAHVVTYDQLLVPKAFLVNTAVAQGAYMGISDDARQATFAKMVAEEFFKMAQAAGLGGASPQANLKPTSKVALILANKCASCHSKDGSYPQLDLTGDPEKMHESVRLLSFTQVATGKMPKKSDKLSQGEYDEIGLWLERTPPDLKIVRSAPPAVNPVIPPAVNVAPPSKLPEPPKAENLPAIKPPEAPKTPANK